MIPGNRAEEIAIIVPFNEWNLWVIECVSACARLERTGADLTLWLVPDEDPDPAWRERLKPYLPLIQIEILPTGAGNPSQKRNAALRAACAPIIALIDSDARPGPDWLVRAWEHLKERNADIVTGPNLTPPDDPLMRRICGRVMESRIGFGKAYIRHVPLPMREVREMPTCNMVYRRVPEIGFREELDTAEDMAFCAEMRAAGCRILYSPDVRVYHHRRAFPVPFIRQFYGYGLNKGRLARGGSDSAHAWHAVPALFVIYLVSALILSFFLRGGLAWIVRLPFAVYLAAILLESVRKARSAAEFVLCIPAFIAGHLAYGAGYLAGLVRGKIRSGPSFS